MAVEDLNSHFFNRRRFYYARINSNIIVLIVFAVELFEFAFVFQITFKVLVI
ncbi:MAG: hypothetical protein H6Q21_1210 [Bacteroidetes bacterium]|nr:hypothetical protein [Bacteroidota bacterium]